MLDEWAGLGGKVAVVPGGAGGLGRACTVALAQAGVTLAVCDRDEAALDTVKGLIEDAGGTPTLGHFDVRDSDALAAFFDQVDTEHGRVDILVNIPGGGFRLPTVDMSPKGTMAVIRQNFLYVLESCQHAARRMIAQGTGGSIVNMSTIEAHRAMPDMGVYGAMKAAVEHLTTTLAVELGPHGIRVNAIAPGYFETRMSSGVLERSGADIALAAPMGRIGQPGELKGVAVFLASSAAAYITGQIIAVDGGTTAS